MNLTRYYAHNATIVHMINVNQSCQSSRIARVTPAFIRILTLTRPQDMPHHPHTKAILCARSGAIYWSSFRKLLSLRIHVRYYEDAAFALETLNDVCTIFRRKYIYAELRYIIVRCSTTYIWRLTLTIHSWAVLNLSHAFTANLTQPTTCSVSDKLNVIYSPRVVRNEVTWKSRAVSILNN